VEGDSQEGWLITDTGAKELERGELHPTMIDEGVTPRQQFEAIARQIGIIEDRVVLPTDIVWSGEYEDLTWVWDALGQADIRNDLRKVWCNSWRAKLHKGIPPELESELTNVSREVTAEGEKGDICKCVDWFLVATTAAEALEHNAMVSAMARDLHGDLTETIPEKQLEDLESKHTLLQGY
ncbi:unnamed protein product, partial [marine sediment metagenome]